MGDLAPYSRDTPCFARRDNVCHNPLRLFAVGFMAWLGFSLTLSLTVSVAVGAVSFGSHIGLTAIVFFWPSDILKVSFLGQKRAF